MDDLGGTNIFGNTHIHPEVSYAKINLNAILKKKQGGRMKDETNPKAVRI